MLSWMYWPHRAQETTRSGGERRREPTISTAAARRQAQAQAKRINEVLELSLVEPEEFGNDPYNRIGPLSRRQKMSKIP